MKSNELRARTIVTLVGFLLIAIYVGVELAAKYLFGAVAVGLLAITVILVWNRMSQ